MTTLNIQLLRRNSKRKSINYRCLRPDLAPLFTLSDSNNPCIEQYSMVPKMFKPLKFVCTYIVLKADLGGSVGCAV